MTRNRRREPPPEMADMFRRLCCAVTWMLVIGFSLPDAPAQDAAHRAGEPESKAARRELVQQLGDASYVVRDEAAKELVRQGPAAKDVLTEALADPDPEIRSRARLLLDRISQAAEAEDTGDPVAGPGPTAAQRELVQQLGDPSFFTREQAAEKLASQGATAKGVLWEALRDPDLEIRWRARRVLSRVQQNEFAARLAAFIAGTDGEEEHDLPGWKRFRDLIGEGRDAREMFATMMRAEWSLLSAYEEQSPELPALFAGRTAWLQSRAARGNSDARVVPPQTVATLLLIGSDETVKDHSRGLSQLYPLLTNLAAMRPVGLTARSSIQRTLLETWVTSAASSGSTYGMMVALKYGLEEAGLQQATQFIEQGTKSSSALHYAIVTLGRFGGEEHIRLLTPLLDNKTVCHTWSNRALKKDGTIKVEVRDAALVVVLRMTGKDPAKYGFKLLKENPETLYYMYTFGFIDDEERAAAHAKWAAESRADED